MRAAIAVLDAALWAADTGWAMSRQHVELVRCARDAFNRVGHRSESVYRIAARLPDRGVECHTGAGLIALAAMVAIALSAGALLGPIAEPVRAEGFVLVGTHPQASQQPTARGRMLNFLKHWDGRIYAGYGDYGANTGPIAIAPFDPSTNTFSRAPFWADSEELQVFRVLNGKLYAPSIDTRAGADYADTRSSGRWLGHDVVASFHVYDMTTLTGSDLWMVGSAGASAVAWRSVDGGASWTEELAVPPMTQGAGDFARFYFAGAYRDRLYVQATDFFFGPHPTSRVFDGSSWSAGPSFLPSFSVSEGYDTEPFDGRLVYLTRQSGLKQLRSFDGAAVSTHGPPELYNYSVDGPTLYALGADGLVSTTTDLVRWTTLEVRAPITARSIVVIKGVIYVGTTDSRIYRYERASAIPPGTSPPAGPPPPPAACRAGRDNDGDGLIDHHDPGCSGSSDPTEAWQRLSGKTAKRLVNRALKRTFRNGFTRRVHYRRRCRRRSAEKVACTVAWSHPASGRGHGAIYKGTVVVRYVSPGGPVNRWRYSLNVVKREVATDHKRRIKRKSTLNL
jgi:hypothetical protein